MEGTPRIRVLISSVFDLGGSFEDSLAVIESLKSVPRYSDAERSRTFQGRMQASYRFSYEPVVRATSRREEFSFSSLAGDVTMTLDLHPEGLITFGHWYRLPAGVQVGEATGLLEAFFGANAPLYGPYLDAHAPSSRQNTDNRRASADTGGLDLVSEVQQLRALLGGLLSQREAIYYPIDSRIVVTSVAPADRLISHAKLLLPPFRQARSGADHREVDLGTPLERIEGRAALWDGTLAASFDSDAVLLCADSWGRVEDAAGCIQAAHGMWFLARAWVGVLDAVGTYDLRSGLFDDRSIRELEQRVIKLSELEFRITKSLTVMDAGTVMVREPWQAQLIDFATRALGSEIQRRLVRERLAAVDRNHNTVAEILDRSHQKTARAQGDRLQVLFAGSLAAGLTALIPTTFQLHGADAKTLTYITWAATVALWATAAVVVVALGVFRVRVGRDFRNRRARVALAALVVLAVAGFAATIIVAAASSGGR